MDLRVMVLLDLDMESIYSLCPCLFILLVLLLALILLLVVLLSLLDLEQQLLGM